MADNNFDFDYIDSVPQQLRLSSVQWLNYLENLMAEEGFPKFYTVHHFEEQERADRILVSAKNTTEAVYKIHRYWYPDLEFFGDVFNDFVNEEDYENEGPMDVIRDFVNIYVNGDTLWITEVRTIL